MDHGCMRKNIKVAVIEIDNCASALAIVAMPRSMVAASYRRVQMR